MNPATSSTAPAEIPIDQRPPRAILRRKCARPFFAGHPWVFSGSIARIEGKVKVGDEVVLVSDEGQFVARGLYNPEGAIRVRLYRWADEPMDEAFFRERITAALRLRDRTLGLGEKPQPAYRAVFSEADGLSGLTVDRFDKWLVVQISSRALFERRGILAHLLFEVTGAEGMVLRVDRSTAALEGFEKKTVEVLGTVPTEPIEILENDLSYRVDVLRGQKTGFYLDQRANRLAVARFARGRRVLDLFCHQGGFSLCALKHGNAAETLGIDSSSVAIEAARAGAERNGLTPARFEAGDVFEYLERLRDRGERFGLIVCDPPKFARRESNLEEAFKAYVRLNRAAVEVLEPEGVLATCSCSGAVDRSVFLKMLAQVAERTGRAIRVLESRGQDADHPIAATCPESDYLKCLICRAD